MCFLPASLYLHLFDLTSAGHLLCLALTSSLWVTPALHLLQIQFYIQSVTENGRMCSVLLLMTWKKKKNPVLLFYFTYFPFVFLFIVIFFFSEFIEWLIRPQQLVRLWCQSTLRELFLLCLKWLCFGLAILLLAHYLIHTVYKQLEDTSGKYAKALNDNSWGGIYYGLQTKQTDKEHNKGKN